MIARLLYRWFPSICRFSQSSGLRRSCVCIGPAFASTGGLRRILRAYAGYYNDVRTHRSLDKDAPSNRTPSLADFITTTCGFSWSTQVFRRFENVTARMDAGARHRQNSKCGWHQNKVADQCRTNEVNNTPRGPRQSRCPRSRQIQTLLFPTRNKGMVRT
jgi:hypothetical protein